MRLPQLRAVAVYQHRHAETAFLQRPQVAEIKRVYVIAQVDMRQRGRLKLQQGIEYQERRGRIGLYVALVGVGNGVRTGETTAQKGRADVHHGPGAFKVRAQPQIEQHGIEGAGQGYRERIGADRP